MLKQLKYNTAHRDQTVKLGIHFVLLSRNLAQGFHYCRKDKRSSFNSMIC